MCCCRWTRQRQAVKSCTSTCRQPGAAMPVAMAGAETPVSREPSPGKPGLGPAGSARRPVDAAVMSRLCRPTCRPPEVTDRRFQRWRAWLQFVSGTGEVRAAAMLATAVRMRRMLTCDAASIYARHLNVNWLMLCVCGAATAGKCGADAGNHCRSGVRLANEFQLQTVEPLRFFDEAAGQHDRQ